MKVYAAQHCSCIYESAYYTISLHQSKDGAKKAIRKSRRRELKDFKSNHYPGKVGTLSEFQAWTITTYEVLS